MKFMKIEGKRGLSPIIATVMLIIIVMILGAMIYIWARGFVTESVIKFNEPIQNSCANVKMVADAYGGKIRITNQGTVAIYGLEVQKQGVGATYSSGVIPFDSTVTTGQNGETNLPSGLAVNDAITIMPVLLGEGGTAKKSFSCTDIGINVNVGA